MIADPWSILAGPTSYGLIECEITRYSCLVDGPGINRGTKRFPKSQTFLIIN